MTAEAISRPPGFVDGARRRVWPIRAAQASPREIEVAQELPPLKIHHGSVDSQAITVLGRKLDVYHAIPTQDIAPIGRILLANGWRSKVPGQHEFIDRLVEAGYSVTTFTNDFTRGDREKIREADNQLDTRTLPKIAFVKAAAVHEALKAFPSEQPDERVGIVAHSEATIYAGIAATTVNEPDFFIQINSAGHARKLSLPRMLINGVMESIHNRETSTRVDPEKKVSPGEVVMYIRQNFSLAHQELVSMRVLGTDRLVEHLHEHGLPTAYIGGTRDRVFPRRDMDRVIERGIFDYVGDVPNGAHEICSDPNGYADEVLTAIDSFGALQKEREQSRVVFQA